LSILEKVRRWIDGETGELVLEEAARDAQVTPRSRAEEFIVKVAREIEQVMQNELVPLPQGTTIIPSEYIVFLSTEDDREWQGVKRKGLEQGLYHILAERAKEIAGKRKLDTKSFVIELRVDGTLGKDDVRVQHSWDDGNSAKTGVLSRPKGFEAKRGAPPSVDIGEQTLKRDTPVKGISPVGTGVQRSGRVEPPIFNRVDGEQAVPLTPDDQEEMTHVASRSDEIYKLEVWRNGVRQSTVPIFQKEIVIGRGSRTKPVDIPLSGDAEVSRRHLTLSTDGEGHFWATSEGKNPASLSNFELPPGQRVTVTPGIPINICSYTLRIQANS
jgi:hypothetical protein